MDFEGALIREQGLTFGVVVVRPHVIQSHLTARETIRSFQPAFPGCPIVLMAQDAWGVPTYYGRRDLVDFLAHTPLEAIPWSRFSWS